MHFYLLQAGGARAQTRHGESDFKKLLRRIIMTTANQKKSIKLPVVITYAIATALLILGWFIPAFGYGQGLGTGDMLLFMYIPAVINALFNRTVIPASVIGDRTLPEFMTAPWGDSFNAPALMIIIYLVVTVLAIVFLIPVLAGKKTKRTSIVNAYIIEGASLVTFALLFLFSAWQVELYTTVTGYLNLTIVSAAVLVLLCIQCIYEKGSYGVIKMFLFLASYLAFMFAMFRIDDFLDIVLSAFGAGSAWDNLLNTLNVQPGLMESLGGLAIIKSFVDGTPVVSADYTTALNVINVCVIMLFFILAINLAFDFVGLMSGNQCDEEGYLKPHTVGKIIGIVRNLLALIIAIIMLVCIIIDPVRVGMCIYFAIFFISIGLELDIIRLALVPSQKRRTEEQREADRLRMEAEREAQQLNMLNEDPEQFYAMAGEAPENSPIADTLPEMNIPAMHDDGGEQLVISTLPAEEPEEPQPEPIVYTPRPVIYNGPTDEFIDTLTTEEKIEFSKAFLDKTKGELPTDMPEYEIGGNNEDFFLAIFMNLGKFRAMLSAKLLRKVYKYLNDK